MHVCNPSTVEEPLGLLARQSKWVSKLQLQRETVSRYKVESNWGRSLAHTREHTHTHWHTLVSTHKHTGTHSWAHTYTDIHSWAHTYWHTLVSTHTYWHTCEHTHWHTLVSTHTGIRILGCASQITCDRGPVLLSPSNLSWINMSTTLKLLEKWIRKWYETEVHQTMRFKELKLYRHFCLISYRYYELSARVIQLEQVCGPPLVRSSLKHRKQISSSNQKNNYLGMILQRHQHMLYLSSTGVFPDTLDMWCAARVLSHTLWAHKRTLFHTPPALQ